MLDEHFRDLLNSAPANGRDAYVKDSVLNAYFKLLGTMERCSSVFLSTYFGRYANRVVVSQNTQDVKDAKTYLSSIFARAKRTPSVTDIFFPYNVSNTHWALLRMEANAQLLYIYDSLRGSLNRNHCLCMCKIIAITLGLKHGKWQLVSTTTTPRQLNAYDCGVLCCMFAHIVGTGGRVEDCAVHLQTSTIADSFIATVQVAGAFCDNVFKRELDTFHVHMVNDLAMLFREIEASYMQYNFYYCLKCVKGTS